MIWWSLQGLYTLAFKRRKKPETAPAKEQASDVPATAPVSNTTVPAAKTAESKSEPKPEVEKNEPLTAAPAAVAAEEKTVSAETKADIKAADTITTPKVVETEKKPAVKKKPVIKKSIAKKKAVSTKKSATAEKPASTVKKAVKKKGRRGIQLKGDLGED